MGRETDEASPLQEQNEKEEKPVETLKADVEHEPVAQSTELSFDDLDDIDWLEPVPAQGDEEEPEYVDYDDEPDDDEPEADDRQMSLF